MAAVRRARGTVALLLLHLTIGCGRDGRSGGRIVVDTVYSPALNGNALGDADARAVHVYLPPGYDAAADPRYPAVYLLHAYGSGPESWLGGETGYEGLNVRATLDSLIATGEVEPMLVVMPDARTRLGGSWYANSRVAGDWQAFVARDLVAHVDSVYRTIAARSARGIAGQSMGAYGAARIATRFHDVFGAVLIMSPVVVTDPNPVGAAAMRAALDADALAIGEATVLARLTWSKAIAFSPDPTNPPLYARLPFEAHGDRLVRIDPVWDAWLANGLVPVIEADPDALRATRVHIEVGDADPLFSQAHTLSAALDSLSIDHTFDVFTGDHTVGVRGRFEFSVFQFFTRSFARSGLGARSGV